MNEQARLERIELLNRFRLAYNRLLEHDRVVVAEVLKDEMDRIEGVHRTFVRIGRRELVWAAETLAQKAADERGQTQPG